MLPHHGGARVAVKPVARGENEAHVDDEGQEASYGTEGVTTGLRLRARLRAAADKEPDKGDDPAELATPLDAGRDGPRGDGLPEGHKSRPAPPLEGRLVPEESLQKGEHG